MRSTRPSLSIAFRSFWLMALISEGSRFVVDGPLHPFIIVKPQLGSGTFLPGGRPPVNVSCKGGRSPNSAHVRNHSDAWHTDTENARQGACLQKGCVYR